nr:hypothetical protein [Natronococcus sp. AD5]
MLRGRARVRVRTLATIYRDYHLELVPGTEDLDLMATITARPKNEIPMTVRER